MRRCLILMACLSALALFNVLLATEPPLGLESGPTHLADAALHGVHFVDAHEGWACGDDGLILHTLDGGKTWERQVSGTRASLRGFFFHDAFVGFCVGRETLPHGSGSAGILLYTDDGGTRWQVLSYRDMPGLAGVHFVDGKHGYLWGEGSEQQPTGLFFTADGGSTWKMLPGERRPGWTSAAWNASGGGLLAGPGGLALVARGQVTPLELTTEGGRLVRAVARHEDTFWAVGERGLMQTSSDGAGSRWQPVDLDLPVGVRESWDFGALAVRGNKLWLAGRPGSLILHSWDGGRSWQAQATGQNLPLHSICFVDDERGWAVGAAGTVLSTTNGGKSWTAQRRGGHRAAALVITARSATTPLGTIALLGGDEGYLVTAIQVAREVRSPEVIAPSADLTFHDAVRQCGGLAGEVLAGFGLPTHFEFSNASTIARHWGGGDEAAGLQRLEEQLVLALRLWQPEVVITDAADPRHSGGQLGALIALALRNACQKAGRADVWPDQLAKLDLKPWTPRKLYGRVDEAPEAQVVHDLDFTRPGLLASASDVAARARGMLGSLIELTPSQDCFRLLWSTEETARHHQACFQGSTLERGGQARRALGAFDQERFDAVNKLTQERRDAYLALQPMLTEPTQVQQVVDRLLRTLAQLDDEHGAELTWMLAQHSLSQGQWLLAREMMLVLMDRYPAHRATPASARWLAAFQSSTLAEQRVAQGHFLTTAEYDFRRPPAPVARRPDQAGTRTAPTTAPPTIVQKRRGDLRAWHKGSLAAGDVLAAYGPQYFGDPRVQFCLQAAQRHLDQADRAMLWNTQFLAGQASGPWRAAAAAEVWLLKPEGPCPRGLAQASLASEPPYLDGKFDDPCWQGAPVLTLRDVFTSPDGGRYTTTARLAYDAKHLYVALCCEHPEGGHFVPPVKPRKRDDDLRSFDRVALLLDVDRTGVSYCRFEMDQRGCVAEDCWGDRGWNPKWFVAVDSSEARWQIEAAIPWADLVGTAPAAGDHWAVNLVRTIPGKGVQALSLPADVVPLPEGAALLRFAAKP